MKKFILTSPVSCLLTFLFLVCSNNVLAEQLKNAYQFASIELLIEQEIGRMLLPKIYQQLGLSIEITPLPADRAQYMAVNSLNDGEIMRIWSYGIENPTTIRVPTPYYYLETMPFVNRGSGILINSVEDLSKYRIARVRGVKHTNNITKGLTNVYDAKNTESMFKLLKQDMVDVVLTNTLDGNLKLKELGYLDKIIPMAKPLNVHPLYQYLSQDNRALVPIVDKEIQRLTKSGTLQKWVKFAESTMLNNAEND